METIVLPDAGWDAAGERLRELRKAPPVAVLVRATNGLRVHAADRSAARAALDRLAVLPHLTVAALDGPADEAALALALACDHAVAGSDLSVGCSAAGLLELGVASGLAARAGELAAHRLLLRGDALDVAALAGVQLVTTAADPAAAGAAACARAAADPAWALVLRALRAARRSTAAQAADYERELVALLGGAAH
jgi:enoyl-CoA hydratase/carnithine racemase